MREHNNGVSHHKKGRCHPERRRGALWWVYWGGWGGAWVGTSGHKEAHPPSSSSGCLGSDAAAALKLPPSCPDYELSAEDEDVDGDEDEDEHEDENCTGGWS